MGLKNNQDIGEETVSTENSGIETTPALPKGLGNSLGGLFKKKRSGSVALPSSLLGTS